MEKYILISVYERDICTEVFDSFDAAVEQMKDELKEHFEDNKSALEYGDEEITWEEFEEYPEDYDDISASFDDGWAWSNLNDDCNCDWKIVKVE